MELTPTTATPHPKLAFSFPRQTFSCRKAPNLDSKLLIMMCIIVDVCLRGFTASLALESLDKERILVSLQYEAK